MPMQHVQFDKCESRNAESKIPHIHGCDKPVITTIGRDQVRGVSLTINSGFSHRIKASWFIQSLLAGSSSISKLNIMRARIMRISTYARLERMECQLGPEKGRWDTNFRPIQLRGPKLNGCMTDRLSFT